MSPSDEQEIFLNAIEESNLEKRAAYLSDACGADARLRANVDLLLQAHDQPKNVLDEVPDKGFGDRTFATFSETIDRTDSGDTGNSTDQECTVIDNYRLMEQIGEGGFGLVFVAQQERPVRRQVALKIIKPGTASKEVIARFEAERQAVALMDHPNIAQVFDAGVTTDGRPYFVMELVRGVPISEFADAKRLPIDDRLRLFKDVCSAVQHAHQKGIIHRDLKPSNVMVTLHDNRPVVKVIDFGVAKAIGQSLTDKTIYTRFFSMIGTPLYMSPEQAEMSGLDVDTRSDIYSLGVMLYELLTGTTPFDRDRLDSAGYDELRRIIREEEPPVPSSRITTMGNRLTTVAESRQTIAGRLSTSLRGDLDWIVMKSLDKDRTRRYDSAAAMAEDITRFLQQQTVDARPPSRRYQLMKFARRNRGALVTASLISISLLAGTFFSLWQMFTAMDERDRKDAALRDATIAREEVERLATVLASANVLLSSGQVHADAGRWDAANQEYSEAIRLQPNYFLPWVQRAQLMTRLRLWPEAAHDYSQALSLGAPTQTVAWEGSAALLHFAGRESDAAKLTSLSLRSLNEETDRPLWQALRDVVTVPSATSKESSALLADLATEWLSDTRPPRDPNRRPRRDPPNMRGQDDRELNRADRRTPTRRDELRPPRNFFDSVFRDGPPGGDNRSRQPGSSFGGPRFDERTPRPVKLYLTGLAHLRDQRWKRAEDLLQQSADDRMWPSHDLMKPALAITAFKLGKIDKAEKLVADSTLSVETWTEKWLESPDLRDHTPWFDVIEAIVIHREAHELIHKTSAPAWPTLDRVRDKNLMILSE